MPRKETCVCCQSAAHPAANVIKLEKYRIQPTNCKTCKAHIHNGCLKEMQANGFNVDECAVCRIPIPQKARPAEVRVTVTPVRLKMVKPKKKKKSQVCKTVCKILEGVSTAILAVIVLCFIYLLLGYLGKICVALCGSKVWWKPNNWQHLGCTVLSIILGYIVRSAWKCCKKSMHPWYTR